MNIVQTRSGEMLDAVVHRFYGKTGKTVEAVLDANPHLAGFGPVLPAGTTILLPPHTRNTLEEPTQIKLWGT